MRADGTEAGKLVRLADVAQWLIGARELPLSEAVEAVSKGLRGVSPVRVFRALPDRRAALVNGDTALPDDDEPRGRSVTATIVLPDGWAESQPKGRYRLAICDDAPPPKPKPAAAAVVADYIRDNWAQPPGVLPWAPHQRAEFMGSFADRAADLAVSVADAVRLWGWGTSAEPVPAAAAAAPVARAPASQAKPRRQDLLAPVIERAMREAGENASASEVFNILRNWAREPNPTAPFLGVTTTGLKWIDASDEFKELSLRALGERLKRARKVTPAHDKSR